MSVKLFDLQFEFNSLAIHIDTMTAFNTQHSQENRNARKRDP